MKPVRTFSSVNSNARCIVGYRNIDVQHIVALASVKDDAVSSDCLCFTGATQAQAIVSLATIHGKLAITFNDDGNRIVFFCPIHRSACIFDCRCSAIREEQSCEHYIDPIDVEATVYVGAA